jgi:hypothetical protein
MIKGIGINLEFEKNVPFPLGKRRRKDRPATAKDLICLWIENEGEAGDSFKVQGKKLRNNVMQHFNAEWRPDDKGYTRKLSYRTVDAKQEIYRIWIVEISRYYRRADGSWNTTGPKREHQKIRTRR